MIFLIIYYEMEKHVIPNPFAKYMYTCFDNITKELGLLKINLIE